MEKEHFINFFTSYKEFLGIETDEINDLIQLSLPALKTFSRTLSTPLGKSLLQEVAETEEGVLDKFIENLDKLIDEMDSSSHHSSAPNISQAPEQEGEHRPQDLSEIECIDLDDDDETGTIILDDSDDDGAAPVQQQASANISQGRMSSLSYDVDDDVYFAIEEDEGKQENPQPLRNESGRTTIRSASLAEEIQEESTPSSSLDQARIFQHSDSTGTGNDEHARKRTTGSTSDADDSKKIKLDVPALNAASTSARQPRSRTKPNFPPRAKKMSRELANLQMSYGAQEAIKNKIKPFIPLEINYKEPPAPKLPSKRKSSKY